MPAMIIKAASDTKIVDLDELWRYRYFYYVLVWRSIKVRYQQTVIGVGWVILQPLVMMLLFTFIFGRLANFPSNDKPYPVFVLCALTIWQFISQALTQASTSVVANAHLVTKIYFPRILLPLAAITTAAFDYMCNLVLLFIVMAIYGVWPTWGILLFIPMFFVAVALVLGLSLWFGALNVRFRDIGYLLPFLTQIWMFASPVIYASSMLPSKYNLFFALNPLVSIIDTARWAFLGTAAPDPIAVAISMFVAIGLLASGLYFFRRHEPYFADIV